MLTDEQRHILQRDLGNALLRILREAHLAVDAEILLLCTNLESKEITALIDGDAARAGWKKTVTVELDLHAVEVLHALRRMRLSTYGSCERCGNEIPFEELRTEPAERFCSRCRATVRTASQN